MSAQFYCNFSGEQARQHGIPRGVIEIHADSLNEAREIATKWFPATKDLPDHPRLRGEHLDYTEGCAYVLGSSPPTRGAHHTPTTAGNDLRIIPAYAGSTVRRLRR